MSFALWLIGIFVKRRYHQERNENDDLLRNDKEDVLTEEDVNSLPLIKFGTEFTTCNIIKEEGDKETKNNETDKEKQDEEEVVEKDKNDYEDLEATKTTTKKETSKTPLFTSSTCSICICEFENRQDIRVLPRCGHVFHDDCIKPWLLERNRNSCPLCQVCVI